MSAQPVRVVRSRVKGSKLTSPNGLPVVCVTRGTKFGNPHRLPAGNPSDAERRALVALFRRDLYAGRLGFTVDDVKRDLRGRNLACWCKIGQLCHADVLLEVANS